MENSTLSLEIVNVSRTSESVKEAAANRRKEIGIAVLFMIFVVLNFLGNSLVLTIMLKKMKNTFRTVCILLTSLAVADLLHGCFVGIPSALNSFAGTWYYGTIVCKVYAFIRAIIGEVSVLTLALIGCDRFRTLRKPDNKPIKSMYLYISISVIWVYLILVGSPYLVLFDVYERKDGTTWCAWSSSDEAYTEFIAFVLQFGKFANFFVPFTFVLICYSGILFLMWKAQRRVASLNSGSAGNNKQKQVARVCIIMMLGFIICWTPYRVVLVLRVLRPKDSSIPPVITYSRLVAMFGSCLNPVIYGLLWKRFRDATIEMLSPVLCVFCPKWIKPGKPEDERSQMGATSGAVQITTRFTSQDAR